MNAAQLLGALIPPWRASLPPSVPLPYFDGFIRRNRRALEDKLGVLLAHMARAQAPRAAAPDLEDPPDLRTAGERTKANLAAVKLVVTRRPGEFTAADLRVLLGYSGHGGLSIEKVRDQYPPELVPETFGLIHEYYTPTALAQAIGDAVCPLLPSLVGRDGFIRALEPSAGIGRLVRSLSARRCLALQAGGQIKGVQWTTVEFSKVSSRLLRATRPDTQHFEMPFERWIHQEGARHRGTINLILSNPPYGERGAMALEDPDESYRERTAFAYFMRRALDLLVPGGLGVFLVPAGFLSSKAMQPVRDKLLRRYHLAGAFRLPSHGQDNRLFVPGAFVVMDLLFWRSRGGELTEIDVDDQSILEGDYFADFPAHILGAAEGKPIGAEAGESTTGAEAKKPWRYKVVGDFTGLPPLVERPLCSACVLEDIARSEPQALRSVVARESERIPEDVEGPLRSAVELGHRVQRYLAEVAADNADRAAALWPELHAALRSFAETRPGSPWAWKELRALAGRKVAGAQQLLNAFDKSGALVAALREAPRVLPRYQGRPDDVVAQAEALFRQARTLSIPTLLAFHASLGNPVGPDTRAVMLQALLAADWNLEGEQLYPLDVYVTGKDLWARHDRAAAWAAQGDPQAQIQVRRLLDAIKPVVFEDLAEFSPQDGYMPLDLVGGWISDTLNRAIDPIRLERVDGLIQARGIPFAETDRDTRGLAAETVACLGWLNHDFTTFKVERERRSRHEGPPTREEREAQKRGLAAAREAMAQNWRESFRRWIRADEARREQVTYAYNRSNRGRVVPSYSREPLEIARWGDGAPRLKPHQIAGARRILDHRGGLLAFDVGVGKTYTAIAVLAQARQSGWVRRPVILVPSSLVWKWHDDLRCTLPDYRVLVIGSNRKRLVRGDRKGLLTSETDSPQERATKWIAFQTGQADVAVLSFDALSRTQMNESAVLGYIGQVEAVSRSIELRRRTLKKKAEQRERKDEKLSERDAALLEHGVKAWVEETLRLPKGQEYDPGVRWDELGIDLLIVDEAAAFKNLYMPQPREDGVPKFMGTAGEGSNRAWQLDFRAAAVRQRTGGAGIVLLTATPAKNSPLEFYNILQFIDPAIFSRSGIHDPEQFIDAFLRIEQRDVLDTSFNATIKSAVVGFKRLDDLRTIILSIGEFRTAAEVQLKLPRPVPQIITVEMDDAQEDKYDRYVSVIEDLLEHPRPSAGNIILGMLARLSMVALHASGDEGYTFKSALGGGLTRRMIPAESLPNWSPHGWARRSEPNETGEIVIERDLPPPDIHSPKFTECAKRIAASPHCGHIVFCEPTATHQWLREVFVEHGIPRERIAILNADETAPADRIRIAREFNGLSSEAPAPGTCAAPVDITAVPKFDVVIANSVAYEGVDMQVRTCTVHHIDLPWTSSDLEQRNGRAVRQGNTLGTVNIFYYFADRSTDGYRFSLIDGKANWLADLLKSDKRDTNNPAAQQQLSPEDILVMISRNKEKTLAIIEAKKTKALEEARQRVRVEATRLFRQANARFRDARSTGSVELARRLREEGEARLSELELVDPAAWPWAPWMYAVRDTEFIVPEDGSAPLHEGLRVAWPRAGDAEVFDHLEFGRLLSDADGETIGRRAPGSGAWEPVRGMAQLQASAYPHEGSPPWPDDEASTEAAIDRRIAATLERGRAFEDLQWAGASDAWLTRWWPRFAARLTQAVAQSNQAETVPVLVDGRLSLREGDGVAAGELLPPTRAGWARYLELAPASGHTFTELLDIGRAWWARRIPQRLLSTEESSAAPPKPPEAEPEDHPVLATTPPTTPDETIVPQPTARRSHFPPGME
jgi:hypothetical protein